MPGVLRRHDVAAPQDAHRRGDVLQIPDRCSHEAERSPMRGGAGTDSGGSTETSYQPWRSVTTPAPNPTEKGKGSPGCRLDGIGSPSLACSLLTCGDGGCPQSPAGHSPGRRGIRLVPARLVPWNSDASAGTNASHRGLRHPMDASSSPRTRWTSGPPARTSRRDASCAGIPTGGSRYMQTNCMRLRTPIPDGLVSRAAQSSVLRLRRPRGPLGGEPEPDLIASTNPGTLGPGME